MATSWSLTRLGHKESNSLIRSLVNKGCIKSDKVKKAFLSVKRSAFLPPGLQKLNLEDSPIKKGIYHQSSPHIYAIVVEALEFEAGHSFLNIGSGTGYLNVLAGYMIGSEGINHGIEVNKQLVEFAREKSSTFINNNSLDISKPTFIAGNFFLLDVNRKQYDRVYCGAECSENQLQDFIYKTIKVGGIAVVPCNEQLLKITRTDSDTFHTEIITSAPFVPLVPLSEEDKQLPLLNFLEGAEELTKRLVEKGSIKSKKIEDVFCMVSRDIFVPPDLKGKAFDDSPIKQGMFHLSAPYVYAMVLEALNIQPGHSFLNIGSGTGYLNVLASYMMGSEGINHGIEVNKQLVEFAREKSSTFINNNSLDISKPTFIAGNFFLLDVNRKQYDRVYCGAKCSNFQVMHFIYKTMKVGGIAVVPCNEQITRTESDRFHTEIISRAPFVPLVPLSEEDKQLPLLNFQEDELGQLRSELSSERDGREAAENTLDEVELLLFKERTEMQASTEHLQEQLQNEREHLQNVEREKQEEVRRLQSELGAAQSRSRGSDGDERPSWELSRSDLSH